MSTHDAHETGSRKLERANAGESWMQQGLTQRYKYSDRHRQEAAGCPDTLEDTRENPPLVNSRETKERLNHKSEQSSGDVLECRPASAASIDTGDKACLTVYKPSSA
jgi:hypothetical protein